MFTLPLDSYIMISKITGGATEYLFTAKVLEKYDVKYYRCKETGFIQTEEPYWLSEAYSSAITSLDIGMLKRNGVLSREAERIILNYFNTDAKFVDYAGGYGIFTRLMRDKGFSFFHTDKYCQNIFANFFDLNDLKEVHHFELLTAFEVFEHFVNPLEELTEMFKYSDNIFFSTELIPNRPITSIEDWWYFIPETGQHLSLYTTDALSSLATQFDCSFYSDGLTMHLFTKSPLVKDPFAPPPADRYLVRKMKKIMKRLEPPSLLPIKESLLESDWRSIKDLLKKN
jgi:hypothetical protein